MKAIHTPKTDARYWSAITLASIFGTNLGDFYAHESGLGLIGGLPILVALFAAVFLVERFDRLEHDGYYWAAIIIIRTGATNIADYLAFRMHINQLLLSTVLALAIAALVWRPSKMALSLDAQTPGKGLPNTNGKYWAAMLCAGVFGTVVGDVCSHYWSQAIASVVLGAMLAAALFAGRKGRLKTLYYYWFTVAIVRTAGTAMGDWLAENKILHIGLPVATVITGAVFVGILVLWRSRTPGELAPA